MCFGRSKTVAAPPPPAPAPVDMPAPPPTVISPAVKTARKNEKKAAAQLAGRTGTILTGPRGVLEEANTSKKTLLGA
jgi:hypothetical protein